MFLVVKSNDSIKTLIISYLLEARAEGSVQYIWGARKGRGA